MYVIFKNVKLMTSPRETVQNEAEPKTELGDEARGGRKGRRKKKAKAQGNKQGE